MATDVKPNDWFVNKTTGNSIQILEVVGNDVHYIDLSECESDCLPLDEFLKRNEPLPSQS